MSKKKFKTAEERREIAMSILKRSKSCNQCGATDRVISKDGRCSKCQIVEQKNASREQYYGEKFGEWA